MKDICKFMRPLPAADLRVSPVIVQIFGVRYTRAQVAAENIAVLKENLAT
jgi:hypothetical protein